MGLARDDGLEARLGIAAPDAVDVAAGPGPDLLEDRAVGLAGRNAQADVGEEALGVEGQGAPDLAHHRIELPHAVVEPLDGDAAPGAPQRGEQVRHHGQRVARGVAVDARMQVAVGGRHRHLLRADAPRHGGDGGGVGVPLVAVAGEDQVGPELGGGLGEEGRERGGARLLLPLEQEGDADGQRAAHGDPGAAGLEEGHHRALVVRGAAPVDMGLAARAGGQRRREGGRGPERGVARRLHVVVAVEQHAGGALGAGQMRHHHRVAQGLAGRGHGPHRREVRHQPVGGGGAVGRMGRIGRDRGDADQREQPVERRIEVRLGMVEDVVRHGRPRSTSAIRAPKVRATCRASARMRSASRSATIPSRISQRPATIVPRTSDGSVAKASVAKTS